MNMIHLWWNAFQRKVGDVADCLVAIFRLVNRNDPVCTPTEIRRKLS